LHLVVIGVITALIALCVAYPFLPGVYDGLAVALSSLAQVFGVVGLLLVPIGIPWFVYELKSERKKRRYYFALASVIAGSVVALAGFFAAFTSVGLAFGILTLILWSAVIFPKLRRLRNAENRNFHPAPLYLMCIPSAVLVLQVALAEPMTEFSRNRAIAQSERFIRDIEQYRAANGQYPMSVAAEWQDYKPGVVGIRQYHYEPSRDAFNLYFEQPTFLLRQIATREIVMYNPLDEQSMVSHDSDILQWAPEDLLARQGWYAVHDVPHPHWKYFWFD